MCVSLNAIITTVCSCSGCAMVKMIAGIILMKQLRSVQVFYLLIFFINLLLNIL
ncbi:hypothetical protein O3M35_004630 [Rhynocoris fuscipes]|uniref:Uncharacterized protein n=1 Tax=Rhynocoris fuscipes TaxID=488301 RepID=A0AAW1CKG8_9HEMI